MVGLGAAGGAGPEYGHICSPPVTGFCCGSTGSWRQSFATVSLNTWVDYALVRKSRVMYVFRNGTVLKSWRDTSNYTGNVLGVSYQFKGAHNVVMGSMGQIRITKAARYTTKYTPCTDSFATTSGCSTIGQSALGGKRASIGDGALVAASADAPKGYAWGSKGILRSISSQTDGRVNSLQLAGFGAAAHPAAAYCVDLVESGYDDWYFPAKNELNQLCLIKGVIGGFNLAAHYGSSSEYSANNSWVQYLHDCSQDYPSSASYGDKSGQIFVRCAQG